MNEFKKIQRNIAPERQRGRQHAIPSELRKFARDQQDAFTGERGVGRVNVPSLCDIYQQLAMEGMELIKANTLSDPPMFCEIGRPAGCVMARIFFDVDFDTQLRALKQRIDASEFTVVASEDFYAKKVSEISLISLAVNLMQLAVEHRKGKL